MANGLRLDPRGLGETVGTSGGKFFFTPPNHSSPKGLMICGCKKSSLKKKNFILHLQFSYHVMLRTLPGTNSWHLNMDGWTK